MIYYSSKIIKYLIISVRPYNYIDRKNMYKALTSNISNLKVTCSRHGVQPSVRITPKDLVCSKCYLSKIKKIIKQSEGSSL